MKLLKKLLLAFGVTIVTLIAMPKIMPEWQNQVQAAGVKISSTKKTMYKGYTYNLKVTGTKKKVKWSSSDKSKASVNSNGKVYAKKNGKVTITAKVAGKKYKCKVTIKNKPYKLSQFNTTFYDLKDVAKEYRDVRNIKNYKDFVFDLDGDGKKDTIRLKNKGKDENGEEMYELQYNGVAFWNEYIRYYDRVYIANLNKKDRTLEVIVKYASVGDGIDYAIFSKRGNKITKIFDEIHGGYLVDDEIKIDQKGKMVLNDTCLQFVSPIVYKEYYQYTNNNVKRKKLDVNKIKNIKFKTTMKMHFIDDMKKLEKYEYAEEVIKKSGLISGKFKKFNILKFTDRGEIKVKLKNGTKGYLFTYSGFLAG